MFTNFTRHKNRDLTHNSHTTQEAFLYLVDPSRSKSHLFFNHLEFPQSTLPMPSLFLQTSTPPTKTTLGPTCILGPRLLSSNLGVVHRLRLGRERLGNLRVVLEMGKKEAVEIDRTRKELRIMGCRPRDSLERSLSLSIHL